MATAQGGRAGGRPVQTDPGDVIFFDSFVPHASGPNRTAAPRRVLYVTYSRACDGDHRARYFADKRRDFPPISNANPVASTRSASEERSLLWRAV